MRWVASVDWYTATTSIDWLDTAYTIEDARIWQGIRKLWGDAPIGAPWYMQGYRGTIAHGVAVGHRGDGTIVNASGTAADLLWSHHDPRWHCTRLDLQVTVWHDVGGSDQVALARRQFDMASGERAGARPQGLFIDGMGKGNTFYVGSPKADRRIRVYDKGSESAQDAFWQGSTRYEVQYRGGAARAALGALGALGGDYQDRVRRIVTARCEDCGIRGLGSLGEGFKVQLPINPRGNTETRMRWLKEQVRPAIGKLILQGVSERDILVALGLEYDEGLETVAQLRSK